MRRYTFFALVGLLASTAQCSDNTTVFGDGGTNSGINNAGYGNCPEIPCPDKTVCVSGFCVAAQEKCDEDEACINDTRCDGNLCVPFENGGHDPQCKQGFGIEHFATPIIKCHRGNAASVSTPMVVDLDGDKQPEIIFVAHAVGSMGGRLVALRGDDCKEVVFEVFAGLASRSQLAIGDLTGDGVVEITGIDNDHRVKIFSNKGEELAVSEPAKVSGSLHQDGGPAIANLDGKGVAEVVYGGMALRYENKTLSTLYNVEVHGGYFGVLSAIADVHLDGKLEVVVGPSLLDGVSGADETPASVKSWKGGYVAVAQWDKSTPEPEIIFVSSQDTAAGKLRVYHPVSGKVVFGPYDFGKKWGGPPTVADFDGDGEPEIGVAGLIGYAVFDQECAAEPMPSFCQSPGVRWFKTTRDTSSGSTGSSVFDFNGDGRAEVVYRDECWLRVYDGATGVVRFARSVTSGTILELPVVADVDADGHADLVVASQKLGDDCEQEPDLNMKPDIDSQGIMVLQDPKNRWMPSRAIWNQHTYHITNIDDDGSIPATEKHSWLGANNYRQNVQGSGDGERKLADLTAGPPTRIEPLSCKNGWQLAASVCNRGAVEAPAGIVGTFYRGDPRDGGVTICSAKTNAALPPGQCTSVQCIDKKPSDKPIDLWFSADDDGSYGSEIDECREENNLLHLPAASCNVIK